MGELDQPASNSLVLHTFWKVQLWCPQWLAVHLSIWTCGSLSFIVLAFHVVKSAIFKLARPPCSSRLSFGDCLFSHTPGFSFSSDEFWFCPAFLSAATCAADRSQHPKWISQAGLLTYKSFTLKPSYTTHRALICRGLPPCFFLSDRYSADML